MCTKRESVTCAPSLQLPALAQAKRLDHARQLACMILSVAALRKLEVSTHTRMDTVYNGLFQLLHWVWSAREAARVPHLHEVAGRPVRGRGLALLELSQLLYSKLKSELRDGLSEF